MPYIKNVESRDSEEGEARQGGLIPVHQTRTLIDRSDSHPWNAELRPKVSCFGVCISTNHSFYPPYKMIEYNQKQSKEIYNALLDSKVDLLEYFLGPNPKHTNYYKQAVKRHRVQSLLNDF